MLSAAAKARAPARFAALGGALKARRDAPGPHRKDETLTLRSESMLGQTDRPPVCWCLSAFNAGWEMSIL